MTAEQAEPETTSTTLQDMRDVNTLLRRRNSAMQELIAIHIAKALDSRKKERWDAAIELVEALNDADVSVYLLVDKWLADNGWDPRAAYKPLAGSGGWIGSVTNADDPYTAAEKAFAREPWGPGVTRDQAMANVVVLHLAEALLDGKSEEVRVWARGLAHELKRERIDLLDDIGRHMQRMALGEPRNEIPF